jgi:hypothetical protein
MLLRLQPVLGPLSSAPSRLGQKGSGKNVGRTQVGIYGIPSVIRKTEAESVRVLLLV